MMIIDGMDAVTAIVCDGGVAIKKEEAPMGDRSPKSKQRDQKQRAAARAEEAAAAKSKQDGQSRPPLKTGKGKT